jgi:ABC-2 type transport system permease protein
MTATRDTRTRNGAVATGVQELGAGVLGAYRVERRKLASQLSTRLMALVCLLGPFAFAGILRVQSGVPADSLFGVWVHESGFAIPMVILSFAGSWGFPVIAGVLAGDIFSSEDRYGTWKMVLTRSVRRRELFAGKALAAGMFMLALVLLAALSSLAAGLVFVGDQRLVSLSGVMLSPGRSAVLVLLSWLTSVLPALAFISLAVLFSVATRSGIMGVLGPVLVALVMQLLALVGTGYWVHTWLVASAFDAWHGLLATHPYYRPLILGIVVSLAWIAVCLGLAWTILRSRDFAGTSVSRRGGWLRSVRIAVVIAVGVAVLAIGSNWGPSAVTAAKLEASIKPTFNNLTLLQQHLLGRKVPKGAHLNDFAQCQRRSGSLKGPGGDWVCTMNMLIVLDGPNPFSFTPVAFDVSVKANGCYKADGPAGFIGQPTMQDAHGHQTVNPLYSFDGCFDPT